MARYFYPIKLYTKQVGPDTSFRRANVRRGNNLKLLEIQMVSANELLESKVALTNYETNADCWVYLDDYEIVVTNREGGRFALVIGNQELRHDNLATLEAVLLAYVNENSY